MECVPTLKAAMGNAAAPDTSSDTSPRTVEPSTKINCPVGNDGAGFTAAVNVTLWWNSTWPAFFGLLKDGAWEYVNVVVVCVVPLSFTTCCRMPVLPR